MFWGQTRSLLLLAIIHGVCIDLFKANCSTWSGPCGESATITCNVTEKLDKIVLINNTDVPLLEYNFFKNETQSTTDKKCSITYTEENLTVTVSISEVQLSDVHKYRLFLNSFPIIPEHMDLNILGICKPVITKTEEAIECEAESTQKNASLAWMVDETKYQGSKLEKTPPPHKLHSLLSLATEMKNKDICCVVSHYRNGVKEENKTCLDKNSTALRSKEDRNPCTHLAFAILTPIALVAAALGFLIKKWKKIVIKGIFNNMTCPPLVRRLSRAPLMGQEESEEENTTIQPSPPNQTV